MYLPIKSHKNRSHSFLRGRKWRNDVCSICIMTSHVSKLWWCKIWIQFGFCMFYGARRIFTMSRGRGGGEQLVHQEVFWEKCNEVIKVISMKVWLSVNIASFSNKNQDGCHCHFLLKSSDLKVLCRGKYFVPSKSCVFKFLSGTEMMISLSQFHLIWNKYQDGWLLVLC